MVNVPNSPTRWISVLPLAMAVLGLTDVRLLAAGGSRADPEPSSASAGASETRRPLPPRALLQLGTADLRTRQPWMTDIAFSPDGRLVAGSEPNTGFPRISLFDVRTGRLVKEIAASDKSQGWVNCFSFSPDGTKLMWGEVMGQVALWDLAQDRMLFRQRLHGGGGLVNGVIEDLAAYTGTVNDVAFSPDGSIMASASIDGSVCLRRVAKPTEVFRDFKTPWSQTGRANRRMGVPGAGPQPGLESARCLAFTPDGTLLLVGSGTTISIWRVEDRQLVRQIEKAHGDHEGATDGNLSSLAVAPDGRWALSAGNSSVPRGQTTPETGLQPVTLNEVRLWDVRTGLRIKDLGGDVHEGSGTAALSRDGRLVAVAESGRVRVLRTDRAEVEQTISLPGGRSNNLAISPDGDLVAGTEDNAIALFDVRTGRRLHHDASTPVGEVTAAGWAAAGDRIVTGHRDGIVRIWETQTGRLLWHKGLSPHPTPYQEQMVPQSVTFSRDGQLVIAAGGAGLDYGKLAVFDATSGRLLRQVEQKEVALAALSPDRRMVVTASVYASQMVKQLHGIEVDTGRIRWVSPPDGERGGWLDLRWMQFRPNSSLLELALGTGDVVHLNALTGREQGRFRADWRPAEQQRPAPPGVLVQLFWEAAFSADGCTLASFAEKAISVWDLETGKLRRTIPHPYGDSCYMALAPDGKTLATSVRHSPERPSEGKIRLYDTGTGELVLTLEPPNDRAVVLAFSPDGTKLFSGFDRGSALVWDVRRGASGTR
jgi:WD40 repeat protein